MKNRLAAVISKEGNDYVALNPDLDIASQGDTPESALTNLREAVDVFFLKPPQRVKSEAASEAKPGSPSSRRSMPKRKVFSGESVCDLLRAHGFEAVRQRGKPLRYVEKGRRWHHHRSRTS